jgi:hypothetical protein
MITLSKSKVGLACASFFDKECVGKKIASHDYKKVRMCYYFYEVQRKSACGKKFFWPSIPLNILLDCLV